MEPTSFDRGLGRPSASRRGSATRSGSASVPSGTCPDTAGSGSRRGKVSDALSRYGDHVTSSIASAIARSMASGSRSRGAADLAALRPSPSPKSTATSA